jgi:DNA-binding response OmpR family regulator
MILAARLPQFHASDGTFGPSRVRSHGSRATAQAIASAFVASFEDGTLNIDLEQRRVIVDGHPVDLAPALYKVLTMLVLMPGDTVSGEELASLTGVSPQRIRSVIARLRLKLDSDHPWVNDGSPTQEVPGPGYRWRSEVDRD